MDFGGPNGGDGHGGYGDGGNDGRNNQQGNTCSGFANDSGGFEGGGGHDGNDGRNSQQGNAFPRSPYIDPVLGPIDPEVVEEVIRHMDQEISKSPRLRQLFYLSSEMNQNTSQTPMTAQDFVQHSANSLPPVAEMNQNTNQLPIPAQGFPQNMVNTLSPAAEANQNASQTAMPAQGSFQHMANTLPPAAEMNQNASQTPIPAPSFVQDMAHTSPLPANPGGGTSSQSLAIPNDTLPTDIHQANNNQSQPPASHTILLEHINQEPTRYDKKLEQKRETEKVRNQKYRLAEKLVILREKLSQIRCRDGEVPELKCNICKRKGEDCINLGIPDARCEYCRGEKVEDNRNCLFDVVPDKFVKRPTAEEVERWKGKDKSWKKLYG